MSKIILISDIHITDEPDLIAGLNPMTRFQAVLDDVAANHPDASHVVLMGDLTHHGRQGQYEQLRSTLSSVPLPTTLMLGNHDRRQAFHTVFGGDPSGFQQQVLKVGDTTLLCLDSLDEGAADHHSGLLCDRRLDWLHDALTMATGPVVVLIHHHLIPSGFDGMDSIRLRNGDQVGQILRASGKCQMVINGHIHRIIFANYHGISQAMIKSPCHQMPMQLGPSATSLSVAEPGGYGVLLLTDHGPVLHHVDVGLPQSDITLDAAS